MMRICARRQSHWSVREPREQAGERRHAHRERIAHRSSSKLCEVQRIEEHACVAKLGTGLEFPRCHEGDTDSWWAQKCAPMPCLLIGVNRPLLLRRGNAGECAGFWPPAVAKLSHALSAGGQKAPRHEIAAMGSAGQCRRLWGFSRGVRVENGCVVQRQQLACCGCEVKTRGNGGLRLG